MGKNMKRVLGVVMAGALVVSMAVPDAEAASKVKLSKKKITLRVGRKATLKVKKATKKVKWSIKSGKYHISLSKKKKTSVVIKGRKAGKAVVQAKVGKKSLLCKVTVKRKESVVLPKETPSVSATPAASSVPSSVPSAPAASQPAAPTAPAATEPAAPTPTPVAASAAPTVVPTEAPTAAPTLVPGQFVYEGLDTSWIDPEKPMVAFTFDDGPVGTKDTDTSIVIQNALRDAGAHATFFYIGSRMNDDGKAEIKRAQELGFEVGNHSYGWSSVSGYEEDELEESIGQTDQLLTEITGYSKFLFRAPNLSVGGIMQDYIKAPFINCGTDSKDWTETATLDKVLENVQEAEDGDIILMHETQSHTAEAVPILLDYFKQKGWQVVSVSELYAVRGQMLMEGQIYSKCPPQ